MITAFASAIHGHGSVTKGLVMAVNICAYSVIFYMLCGSYGLIVAPLIIAWWFMLRGSKQAKIELDYMDTINKPHPTMVEVLKAHYYTGFLTCAALYFYNYEKKPELINNGKFWDCRRPTEFATGLTFDLFLTLLLGVLWITL